MVAVSEGGGARRDVVALAEIGGGAKLRRRPRMTYHLNSQHQVFTHFTQPN